MFMVGLDELFDLIKSLSKSDKRFFKLTVSSEEHAGLISKLFDELEKGNSTIIALKDVELKPLEDNIFTKAWIETKSR